VFIASDEHIDVLEGDTVCFSQIRYPLTGHIALIDFQITIYLRWNAMANRLVGGRRGAIK